MIREVIIREIFYALLIYIFNAVLFYFLTEPFWFLITLIFSGAIVLFSRSRRESIEIILGFLVLIYMGLLIYMFFKLQWWLVLLHALLVLIQIGLIQDEAPKNKLDLDKISQETNNPSEVLCQKIGLLLYSLAYERPQTMKLNESKILEFFKQTNLSSSELKNLNNYLAHVSQQLSNDEIEFSYERIISSIANSNIEEIGITKEELIKFAGIIADQSDSYINGILLQLKESLLPEKVLNKHIEQEVEPQKAITKVDINFANEEELLILPGFNLVLAKKTIQIRNTHGLFHNFDSFVKLIKLKPHEASLLKDLLIFTLPEDREVERLIEF